MNFSGTGWRGWLGDPGRRIIFSLTLHKFDLFSHLSFLLTAPEDFTIARLLFSSPKDCECNAGIETTWHQFGVRIPFCFLR